MKEKELDHLTRDVLAAEQAGMSYGKWKAKHPHTGEPDDGFIPPDDGMEERVCAYCGGKFLASKARPAKIYCCEEHRLKNGAEKEKERKKNRPPKEYTGKPATCGVCGGSFVSFRGAKYCCKECYHEAARRMNRERKRKKMEAKANGST